MLETLKTIIIDFQESNLFTGVPRRQNITVVPGKATVCIGVRRAGKSTFMFQVMKRLMDHGIPRENILYINFFDDRLHDLDRETLTQVIDAYFSIYPEKKNDVTLHCFFDEIQSVPGWEAFVDRVMRTENCRVYITGSSAKLLSREIATEMRGRALSWEIFPFSFREFLDYKGVDAAGTLSTRRRFLVQKAFGEYWVTGGFPEVLGLDQRMRVKVHQEYFHAILFRDVVERYDASHPRAVKDLAHFLLENTASMYSLNRLHGYLKSLGHKVPKMDVADYLDWFEDACFLFTVKLYDRSLRRSKVNPKKIYCIDHSFVRSVTSGILVNSGHLLENLVFTALRPLTPEIYYYKTNTGKEVDFLARLRKGPVLVQVSETIADGRTRKREIRALAEAMQELGIEHGTIVTRNRTETIETSPGVIEVLPAWRFLLNMESEDLYLQGMCNP